MLEKSLPAESAEVQVCQARRMEIVGELTGGVVHDFNNILTVISGTIDILAEAVANRPDLAAIAGLISEAATRGANLTSTLLAFARGQPSQPRDVDVNALLADAARLLRPTLGEHIEIDELSATTPARGTSVKMYLPRASGFVQPLVEVASEGGGEAILIVEDDDLVRRYVVTQVQSLGYRTFAAGNASEALTIIDEGAKIDLLFTDVVMPGSISGWQLAVEARRRRPALKVLYTSGYAKIDMSCDGHLDADALLLAKPYRKVDLAKMIRTAFAA